tara:strand:+ start:10734 stop:10895 length:162 start_codon:yes stop_codon:yes gene_type:complete
MIIDFLKNYAYHILDFFLPVIFVLIYFPFIMSKKTEKVVTRLWSYLNNLSAKR